MTNDSYIPFSQRTGLEPLPPQLKLGEISPELRRFLNYYIGLEVDREALSGISSSYFDDDWERVSMDLHVFIFRQEPNTYQNSPDDWRQKITNWVQRTSIGPLFDFVEFLIRHPKCSKVLKEELTSAFVTARAAYRIVDGQIVAIGTGEQAVAFAKAIGDAEGGARTHLIAAGAALRNGDWAGSIRESIHAVEATAVRLAPNADTLGKALAVLEKHGRLHGSLKEAFGKLYGYSSNQEGIRHALVFDDEAKVDEADALFMLGACASFVSYLQARRSA